MMKYRPDIDALRGIAVLSVILFHIGFSQFSGGFIGVDIFFVISGYVIAKSIEEDLNHDKFSIWKFYNKRIRRIFPALFVTFLVTYIGACFFLLPHLFEKFSASLISSSLFVSNMYFWKDSGYFSNDALTRPLLHTWSLSVEEQYYIFFPILAYAIFHYFKKRWLTFLVPIFIGSLALSIYATTVTPTANFFLLPTRTWELLTGALLAFRSPPVVTKQWLKELLSLGGVAMIIYALFAFEEDTPFPGINALYPCLGAALIIYAGQSSAKSYILNIISNKLLVWVGVISYSLYLVHWPVTVFFYLTALDKPTLAQAFMILAGILVLAYLSWRYVEQPFRKIDPSPKSKKLIYMGLIGMAVACCAGTIGLMNKGFPSRFPDFKYEEIDTNNIFGFSTCFFDTNPTKSKWDYQKCTVINHGDNKALLWGDSFAAHYVPGIIKNQSDIPYTIIQYSAAGCPPILSYYSFANKACTTFNAGVIDVIKEHDIKTVVLSARWNNVKNRGLDGLTETIATLKDMGLNVYVIGQSPEFSIDVQILNYMKSAKIDHGTDKWKIHLSSEINDHIKSLIGDTPFIDPLPYVCEGNSCAYRKDGELLYKDYGHYSDQGSDMAVKLYFPLLKSHQK